MKPHSFKIIDFGIDWITDIFSAPNELKSPEKRKNLVQSILAYVDPLLKPTKKQNVFESENRFVMITSRFLLFQFRGWEWAQKGRLLIFERFELISKIKKAFKANDLELVTSGISRLDFQLTFCCNDYDVKELCKLDGGTGSYKEHYKMRKGQKIFLGYTLYASEYRIRLYNKTEEVKTNDKKKEWLKGIHDSEDAVWRFEVQIERSFTKYLETIEDYATCPQVSLVETEDLYLKMTKKLFSIFNARLKLKAIDNLLQVGSDDECDSQSESAKAVA